MVERPRSETWDTGNITPLRPQRAPLAVEDAGATGSFTEDQVETLGYALAGLKGEIQDVFGELLNVGLVGLKDNLEDAFEARLATALATAKDDFRAELAQQLDTARSTARDDLRVEFEARLERTIKVFREEIDLTVAAVRSEILAKIDRATYGLMLTDIDPRSLERAIGELKIETAERWRTAAARLDGLASGLAELDQLPHDVERLQLRLRAEESLTTRSGGLVIKDARIDAENYRVTLGLANGSSGPTIDLTPLFQRFFDENNMGRR